MAAVNFFTDLRSPCWGCRYNNATWFCDKIGCRFFCGINESAEYQLCQERYYARKCSDDTDYCPSHKEVATEVCRVAVKIFQIKETDDSYGGEYIMEYCKRMYIDKMMDSVVIVILFIISVFINCFIIVVIIAIYFFICIIIIIIRVVVVIFVMLLSILLFYSNHLY